MKELKVIGKASRLTLGFGTIGLEILPSGQLRPRYPLPTPPQPAPTPPKK